MSYYSDQEEERKLNQFKKTVRNDHFKRMKKIFPDRVNIVAEGDSWFAYPKKWFVFGPPSNLVDHISDWTHKKANFYSMANNGDEIVDMLSGDQKHELIKLLKKNDIISVIFKGPDIAFSAYGNIALRTFQDIDIFVIKKDIEKVKKILISHGYSLDLKLNNLE